jgi:adenine-specific DNA-methyltransferase
MTSQDMTDYNIDKLAELFPTVVTESVDADGNVKKTIDFDLLRQELSDHVIEGPQERYRLDWPGKRAAAFAANAPIAKTLRPVREESVDFDTTKNLFIEGDNLDALKLLQESYLGKVKLIYIDPPYNTGNDFVYDDDFAESTSEYLERSGQVDDSGSRLVSNTDSNGRFHSDWLSMMYPRLRLARNLLREDGVICISIDDIERDNLGKIMAEVFGAENFVDSLIWKKRYGGGAKERHFVSLHEYVLVFARNIEALPNIEIALTSESIARYYTSRDANFAARGPYRTHPSKRQRAWTHVRIWSMRSRVLTERFGPSDSGSGAVTERWQHWKLASLSSLTGAMGRRPCIRNSTCVMQTALNDEVSRSQSSTMFTRSMAQMR